MTFPSPFAASDTCFDLVSLPFWATREPVSVSLLQRLGGGTIPGTVKQLAVSWPLSKARQPLEFQLGIETDVLLLC